MLTGFLLFGAAGPSVVLPHFPSFSSEQIVSRQRHSSQVSASTRRRVARMRSPGVERLSRQLAGKNPRSPAPATHEWLNWNSGTRRFDSLAPLSSRYFGISLIKFNITYSVFFEVQITWPINQYLNLAGFCLKFQNSRITISFFLG